MSFKCIPAVLGLLRLSSNSVIRTHHTQHPVILVATITSSKRMQGRINTGRRYVEPSLEEAGHKFPALPVRSHRMCLISPAESCENTCECLFRGKVIRDSAPRVFIWGWSLKHPLPIMCHNPRLPEEKLIIV